MIGTKCHQKISNFDDLKFQLFCPPSLLIWKKKCLKRYFKSSDLFLSEYLQQHFFEVSFFIAPLPLGGEVGVGVGPVAVVWQCNHLVTMPLGFLPINRRNASIVRVKPSKPIMISCLSSSSMINGLQPMANRGHFSTDVSRSISFLFHF